MRVVSCLGDIELLPENVTEAEVLNQRFNGLPEEAAQVPLYRRWSVTGHPRFFVGKTSALSNTVVVQHPAKTFPLAVRVSPKLRVVFYEPKKRVPQLSAVIEGLLGTNAMGDEVWSLGEHESGEVYWRENEQRWELSRTNKQRTTETVLIEYVAGQSIPPHEEWVV